MALNYRLLNVFSIEGVPFSGNPLCVFDRAFVDAPTLSAADMQAWARQFNLSESTFVTTLATAERQASIRIFTPSHEMPFAGHPTLGTAHVVAHLCAAADADDDSAAGGDVDDAADGDDADEVTAVGAVTLSMKAGDIAVRRIEGGWQLRANAPQYREVSATRLEVAAALGVDPEAVVDGGTQWVNVGTEQLVVWLTDAEAVRSCAPSPTLMHEYLGGSGSPPQVYIWAWTGDATADSTGARHPGKVESSHAESSHAESGQGESIESPWSRGKSSPGKSSLGSGLSATVEARFFEAIGTLVGEDPATGSACANLGGWLRGQGMRGLDVEVSQGGAVHRPSRLLLTLDSEGAILVAGRVTEVGRGRVHLLTDGG